MINNKSREYHLIQKKINKILDILEKYNFQYLTEDDNERYKYELKIEYIGDDIIYKDETDYDNKLIYRNFCNRQGNKIAKKFKKAIREIRENNIKIIGYDYDDNDYPCIYIYLDEK